MVKGPQPIGDKTSSCPPAFFHTTVLSPALTHRAPRGPTSTPAIAPDPSPHSHPAFPADYVLSPPLPYLRHINGSPSSWTEQMASAPFSPTQHPGKGSPVPSTGWGLTKHRRFQGEPQTRALTHPPCEGTASASGPPGCVLRKERGDRQVDVRTGHI